MRLQRQESHQTAAFIAAEFLDYSEGAASPDLMQVSAETRRRRKEVALGWAGQIQC